MAAHRSYEEAVTLWEKHGGDDGSQANVARLKVAVAISHQGNISEAEARFRQLHTEHPNIWPWTLTSGAELATALLEQGRVQEARQVLDEAIAARPTQDFRDDPKLSALILLVLARIDTASGRFADARRELEALAQEALASNNVSLGLQCRLELGRLTLAAEGDVSGLETVAREARELGFGSIAAQAQRALHGRS